PFSAALRSAKSAPRKNTTFAPESPSGDFQTQIGPAPRAISHTSPPPARQSSPYENFRKSPTARHESSSRRASHRQAGTRYAPAAKDTAHSSSTPCRPQPQSPTRLAVQPEPPVPPPSVLTRKPY